MSDTVLKKPLADGVLTITRMSRTTATEFHPHDYPQTGVLYGWGKDRTAAILDLVTQADGSPALQAELTSFAIHGDPLAA